MIKIYILLFAIAMMAGGCDYDGIDYDKLYEEYALLNAYENRDMPDYCDNNIRWHWKGGEYRPGPDCFKQYGLACAMVDDMTAECIEP